MNTSSGDLPANYVAAETVLKVFILFPRDSTPLNCRETVLFMADATKGTQINYLRLSSFYI